MTTTLRTIEPDEMERLWWSGYTAAAIARRARVSRERVRQLLAKRGITDLGKGRMDARLAHAILLYEDGATVQAATRVAGVGFKRLRNALRVEGLLRQRPIPAHGTMNRYRRPHLCRCAACRRANADYMRYYMQRKRALAGLPHRTDAPNLAPVMRKNLNQSQRNDG